MSNIPDPRSKNFNKKEREILRSLKTGYLQCSNPAERKKYASNVVWVALCAHWRSVTGKQDIENSAAKVKVLLVSFSGGDC